MTSLRPTLVILGGGPAGCAAAIAARQRGLGPVLVVEASDYRADRVGESAPPDLRLLLQALDLGETFELQRHEPCHGSCSSWGEEALGYNDFLFNANGAGFHLDRRRFDLFMARAAIAAGATLTTRTRYRAAELCDEGFVLQLESAAGVLYVPATAVVDATGSAAHFARSRGAIRQIYDNMFCATAYFHLRDGASFSRLTMLEAVPEGWWYAARLPNRRVAVAFACEGDLVKRRALNTQRTWLQQLAISRHIAPALAECFILADSLNVCPIPCFVLDRPVGRRWIAIGDAATAFDPLSAQGIHKALSTALAAVNSLVAMREGDANALDRYADDIHSSFRDHLRQRDDFYQRERRWPAAPFWYRRRAPSTFSPAS